MNAECAERIPRGMRPGKDSGPSGKDSAGDAARKGFRAERARVRPGKDSGLSGSFGGACPRKAVGMAPGALRTRNMRAKCVPVATEGTKADRLFAGRNPNVLRSRNMRASRTDIWP